MTLEQGHQAYSIKSQSPLGKNAHALHMSDVVIFLRLC